MEDYCIVNFHVFLLHIKSNFVECFLLTRLDKYNINKHILKFFKSINSFGISKTKILRKFYPKKNHKKRKSKQRSVRKNYNNFGRLGRF